MRIVSKNPQLKAVESHEVDIGPGVRLEQLLDLRIDPSVRRWLVERYRIPPAGLPRGTLELLECQPTACATADVQARLAAVKMKPAITALVFALLARKPTIIDGLPPVVCLPSVCPKIDASSQIPVLWHDGCRITVELLHPGVCWCNRCMIFAVRV